MSFYDVVMNSAAPGEKEKDVAIRAGVARTTLRNWTHQIPDALSIAKAACGLNMRPGVLFEEFLADHDREHEQKCSNG
jgi:hypothetical protein